MRHALVCSDGPPRVDRDGRSRRLAHLMDVLRSEGWSVSLFASAGIGDGGVHALQRLGVTVHDGHTDRLDLLLRATGWDLALMASWTLAERYLPVVRDAAPATRVIVDCTDLSFLREARSAFQRRNERDSGDPLDDHYAGRLVREVNACAGADGVLTTSQRDADIIGDLIGDPGLAHVVPDCEDLQPSRVAYARRRGVLWLGSLHHARNVNAVEHLCKDIVPRIDPALLRAHPVSIVGAGLNDAVKAFGRGAAALRMVGWVPAFEPYVERARLSVVPLREEAGPSRTIVQSLLMGTPVVSSSAGVRSLDLRHGEHLLVADTPAAFAASIARLLRDGALWRRLSREGRRQIARAHTPAVARSRLLAAVAAVLARDPKKGETIGTVAAHEQRRQGQQYRDDLVPRVCAIVAETTPPESTVAVVSRGDPELLKLNGRRAWHFPQRDDGVYAGHYPADSADAIAQVEALRERGAGFLVFPRTSFWWLEHYDGLQVHLDTRYRRLEDGDDACIVYALGEPFADARRSSRPAATHRQSADVKLIAFYLPQFHPIPENDAWWGPGFTEWTNVVKAAPQFPGHCQPRLPGELGFYDLRLPAARRAQADLAREYGIQGFCYYHYWFGGKQLLERPFAEVLASGEPDFPFCLCWANEPWSRRWDGGNTDVLQPQVYSHEDDRAHITALLPAFADRRAITVRGKPLFLVYHPSDLPNPLQTTATWREVVRAAGLPGLHLVAVENGRSGHWDPIAAGFDASVQFQPQWPILHATPRIHVEGKPHLRVYDYQSLWPALTDAPARYMRYETAVPGWDNSARIGERAVVLHDATPDAYEAWLRLLIRRAAARPPAHRIVFINAWNEWAEGCYLEPDVRVGRAYLEATRRALAAAAPEPVSAAAPIRSEEALLQA